MAADTNSRVHEIDTERLRLAPVHGRFAERLWPYAADPQITEFLTWAPHKDVEETGRVLLGLEQANHRGEAAHWCVLKSDEPIGIISIIDIRRRHRTWRLDRGELAYWVGRPHQGQGYATEASKAVVAYAREELGLHKVIVAHAAANPASGRIPERLGFRFVGKEKDAFFKSGVWHDLCHFEKILKT